MVWLHYSKSLLTAKKTWC